MIDEARSCIPAAADFSILFLSGNSTSLAEQQTRRRKANNILPAIFSSVRNRLMIVSDMSVAATLAHLPYWVGTNVANLSVLSQAAELLVQPDDSAKERVGLGQQRDDHVGLVSSPGVTILGIDIHHHLIQKYLHISRKSVADGRQVDADIGDGASGVGGGKQNNYLINCIIYSCT